MIILDTNIIIEFVQNEAASVRWVTLQQRKRETLALSTISIVELLGKPDVRAGETAALERWLRYRRIFDVDLSIARRATELRRQYSLKTVDSVIAATALIERAPLASRDRVFRKIHDLELLARLADLDVPDQFRDWLPTITKFNQEARYPGEKADFYRKATKPFAKRWL